MEDWDDVRVFLAVARQGNLTHAAQSLGINHTTVARRLSGLEVRLATRLAVRTTTGITLTPQGVAFLRYAERIEAETLAAEQYLNSEGGTVSGKVRLGTREAFGAWVVCPKIPDLLNRHPGLMVELVSEARVVSLLKGDADITVTLSYPSQHRVVVQKLTDFRFGLFASHSYLRKYGPVDSIDDLRDRNVIWYVDDVVDMEEQRYLQSVLSISQAGFRATNILAQYEVTVAGGAIGMLPFYKASSDPNLVRLLPDEVEDKRSYWLSVHPDSQHLANVRAMIDFLVEIVRERKEEF